MAELLDWFGAATAAEWIEVPRRWPTLTALFAAALRHLDEQIRGLAMCVAYTGCWIRSRTQNPIAIGFVLRMRDMGPTISTGRHGGGYSRCNAAPSSNQDLLRPPCSIISIAVEPMWF